MPKIAPETRDQIFGSLILVALLGVPCGAVWLAWYQAGMQQRAYARQGIEVTRWEIFMGVSPAEKVIQIRERDHENGR